MQNLQSAFSGFSVDDIDKAKAFYVDTLGLELSSETMGLELHLPPDFKVFLYEKADHQPATFTVLNFVVPDIDAAIDELSSKGIEFELYDLGTGIKQDDKGVLRGLAAGMGPDIAWFKDPAGNVLSVVQPE